MTRSLQALALAVLAAALVAAAATGAPSTSERKAKVDEALQRTEGKARAARAKEEVLTSEVASYSNRIRAVETELRPLDVRADALERERDGLRKRLAELSDRLVEERKRLAAARVELGERRSFLVSRVRELYRRGPAPDPVALIFQARNLSEVIAVTELLDRTVVRDRDIVKKIRVYSERIAATTKKISEIRARVDRDEDRVTIVAGEARAAAAEVDKRRDRLADLRSGRQTLLSNVRHDRRELEAEAEDLRRESATLAARIVSAQQAAGSVASVGVPAANPGGHAWPVRGTLTSSFGPRWGRMHEGIDIGAPSGTPIVASAPGTVIVAGSQGGYGQLVVVDHGNGVSTAYAHMSRIGSSVGQAVGQGSVLGYVGCTGHCFGDHLHFEVRVNGSAVNPLGYL